MSHKALAAIALILALTAAVSAHAQTAKTYKITNSSGNVITAVYLSAPGENQWGKNILGSPEIKNGESFIYTSSGGGSCDMDVKFVGTGNRSYILHNIDLCNASGTKLNIPAYKVNNIKKNQTIERAREGK
jgi:hypothetical protein